MLRLTVSYSVVPLSLIAIGESHYTMKASHNVRYIVNAVYFYWLPWDLYCSTINKTLCPSLALLCKGEDGGRDTPVRRKGIVTSCNTNQW